MDAFSYLLGKKSSGGGGGSGGYYITTQIDETNPKLYEYVKKIDTIDISNIINLTSFFSNCKNLESVPPLNTSSALNMSGMFGFCYALKDVPVFNTTKTLNMSGMFNQCGNLTDESLNNILKMCADSRVSATSNKNLTYIFNSSSLYPAEKIQSLSNYQDFVNAGWSIGY